MTNKKSRYIVLISIFAGISILAGAYYTGINGSFYNSIFWIGTLFASIPIFLILVYGNLDRNFRLVLLVLLSVVLYFNRSIFPAADFFRFQDEFKFLETAKAIFDQYSTNVDVHFDMSTYYPGLPLTIVYLKNISGSSFFLNARILIGLLFIISPILVYLFFEKVIQSEKIASVGSFIYIIGPMNMYLHTKFVYSTQGVFLFILTILIMTRLLQKYSIRDSILVIILIMSITVTHHVSSYMMLSFTGAVILLNRYNNILGIDIKKFDRIFVFGIIFMLAWLVYVSIFTVNYLNKIFASRFERFVELIIFGGIEPTTQEISMIFFPFYEQIIVRYMYIPTILILSLIGYWQSRGPFKRILAIFGPISFILSLPLVLSEGSQVAFRLWGFIFIGISFFVASSIYKISINDAKINKIAVVIVSLIIVTGGVSMGYKPINRDTYSLYPKAVSGAAAITADLIYAAQWSEKNLGHLNRMTGDKISVRIFDSLGNQTLYGGLSWRIFMSSELDNKTISQIKFLNYIVADMRTTRTLAQDGVYFDGGKLDRTYPRYGRDEYLPLQNIEKFERYIFIKQIYDNGNMQIYKTG